MYMQNALLNAKGSTDQTMTLKAAVGVSIWVQHRFDIIFIQMMSCCNFKLHTPIAMYTSTLILSTYTHSYVHIDFDTLNVHP